LTFVFKYTCNYTFAMMKMQFSKFKNILTVNEVFNVVLHATVKIIINYYYNQHI